MEGNGFSDGFSIVPDSLQDSCAVLKTLNYTESADFPVVDL